MTLIFQSGNPVTGVLVRMDYDAFYLRTVQGETLKISPEMIRCVVARTAQNQWVPVPVRSPLFYTAMASFGLLLHPLFTFVFFYAALVFEPASNASPPPPGEIEVWAPWNSWGFSIYRERARCLDIAQDVRMFWRETVP